MVGCRPAGRNTEQHDIFFGIGETIRDLIPQLKTFWPGAGTMHVDAWREVNQVDDYQITIVPKSEANPDAAQHLYFLNLGGYKAGEFDEFHYKLLAVANNKDEAIKQAKQTAFYKHTSTESAPSHIDDKFGVDVDELHTVKDILPADLKALYSLKIEPAQTIVTDEMHLGYFPFNKL